jgi:hypothetical protein
MLMTALPTDLHLYSEAAGLVQHAQWCLWADPLTQSEQVGEQPRHRVEHIAEYALPVRLRVRGGLDRRTAGSVSPAFCGRSA